MDKFVSKNTLKVEMKAITFKTYSMFTEKVCDQNYNKRIN